MTEGADARESVITRVFDAPREQVWMEPEQSSRWWGPRGWSKPLSEITMDVRPGGAFRLISVSDEDGTEMVQEGTSPHERIEFISRFADEEGSSLDPAAMGMPPGVPRDVPHEIAFRSADGGTEMNVTEHGYTTDEARDLSRAGMEQCLDKMVAIFCTQGQKDG